MASRYASRQGASASSSPAPPRRSIPIAQPASTASPHLLELRRQWKWAAVSQFLYTFAQLVALDDVHPVDLEEDLVNSTMIVIPRLMQRLLITLTQDRKITVDNWQSALRRQYLRRDPAANPMGIEPPALRTSRAATVETEIKSEGRDSALPDDSVIARTHEGEGSVDEHGGKDGSERDTDGTSHSVEPSGQQTVSLLADGNVKEEEDGEAAQNYQNPLKDWASLSMLEKLESIHTVVEWHFQSPLRLRSIMRSDDETASWRIEPIGYDAKRNAYWFIGGDRLWIQRVPPKPPKKATKRKAASNADGRKAKVARVDRADEGKKKRAKASVETREQAPKQRQSKSVATPKRTGRAPRHSPATNDFPSSPSVVSGRARAAKTQANVKLDLQAKQLAAAKAEMESLNRKSTRKSPSKPSVQRPLGIRLSRRLRGGPDDDDEWQPIPEEWLPKSGHVESKPAPVTPQPTRASARKKGPKIESRPVAPAGRAKIAGLESDDESDLTELSDSETSAHEDTEEKGVPQEPPSDRNSTGVQNEKDGTQDEAVVEPQHLADFNEWETVCISLQEWEEISHRFEKATHYLEKALHKILSQEIVPFVTEALREAEKQRMKEDALMNRKRSSRIAVKEMEKETARLEAIRKAEEEEKMARLRRLEARSRRDEEERLKREQAREQRRKEREERELVRARRLERAGTEEEVDVLGEALPNGAAKAEDKKLAHNEVPKPTHRRAKKKTSEKLAESETWELDCEICGSKGINKDDGTPLMSCGKCNKWQHIPCHDAIDRKAGRTLRNWDAVDFFCRNCRERQFGRTSSPQVPLHLYGARLASGQGHPVSRYQPGYSAAELANGVKPGQVSNNPPLYRHTGGTAPPVDFAHYHVQQSHFPPAPPIPHYQYHPSLNSSPPSVPRSMLTHGSPLPWGPGNHSYSLDSRGANQSVPTQNGVANGYGPNPFSYGAPLAGAASSAHPQHVHPQHQYFPPSEQRLLNSPAYQPQP